MIKTSVKVPSEVIKEVFSEHLDQEGNNRILFSAPFGAGKSTFLKDFFNSNNHYVTLKLYPVNYTVASNEDVFELVKYDLLYELMSNYPDDLDFQRDEFSNLLVAQMFVLHRMSIDVSLKVLSKAASIVTGGAAVQEAAVNEVINTVNDFSSYKKTLKTNELDIVAKFIRLNKNKKGHIHENDEVTELIGSLLDRVKDKQKSRNNGAESETVLIIDDLDRLDPEHTFRLFNIFTAHHDEITETNKFGFDKVVFVCDVNNVAKMFEHKYGIEFSGYIDKFYSSEIFRFDIKLYLKEHLDQILKDKNEALKYFQGNNSIDPSFVQNNSIGNREPSKRFQYILNLMIDEDVIRLRNFHKFPSFVLPNFTIQSFRGSFHVVYYPLLPILYNLERFFPRHVDLENALQLLTNKFKADYSEPQRPNTNVDRDPMHKHLIEICLPFLGETTDLLSDTEDADNQILTLQNEMGNPITVNFNQHSSRGGYDFKYVSLRKIIPGQYNSPVSLEGHGGSLRPNPYWFVYSAYKVIRQKKYLEGVNKLG
jgi:hypothetical protein